MAQLRDRQIISNVEETFWLLAIEIANTEQITLSTYVRNAIIADLKVRGLLSTDLLEKVVAP